MRRDGNVGWMGLRGEFDISFDWSPLFGRFRVVDADDLILFSRDHAGGCEVGGGFDLPSVGIGVEPDMANKRTGDTFHGLALEEKRAGFRNADAALHKQDSLVVAFHQFNGGLDPAPVGQGEGSQVSGDDPIDEISRKVPAGWKYKTWFGWRIGLQADLRRGRILLRGERRGSLTWNTVAFCGTCSILIRRGFRCAYRQDVQPHADHDQGEDQQGPGFWVLGHGI